ncbi:hypothetical protein M433DRAFT_9890 [Acidomyces richmondensis BFW]|nr:hypothetical protein M433DRAFT_9890 [Acidomyces richmondensis BFW]
MEQREQNVERQERNVEIREQIVSRHDNCETQPQRASEPSGEFDLSDQQIHHVLVIAVKGDDD